MYWGALNRARIILAEYEDELQVFMKVYNDNNFWGHPDAVLVAAMVDDNKDTRLWAYGKINQADQYQRKMANDKRRNNLSVQK